MKLFGDFPKPLPENSNSRAIAGRKAEKRERPPRLSPQEVRDKIEIAQQKKNAERSVSQEIRDVRSAMPDDLKAEGDDKPVSDVSTNDPNDPVTKEKLKSLLTSGGFTFNGKEQEVLAKILANE
jgi:hypothetical protein